MTKKKNWFFAFCFSLIPGAGQMYLGFMKMGLSLMLWFGLIISITVLFNFGIGAVFIVVIWFYSFFLTHNIRAMSDEEFYLLEDKYLLPGNVKLFEVELLKKYHKAAAAILILLGISMVWNNLFHLIRRYLPQAIADFAEYCSYTMPQVIIGVGIMIAGIVMIRGKKKVIFEQIEAEEENISKEEGGN